MLDELARTAAWYRHFAESETRGRSRLYSELSTAIAEDDAVLGRMLSLPLQKRQPNLVLASYRWLFGLPTGWLEFRTRFLDDWTLLSETVASRSTQTNEPGRCATLMPVLALLPQPLALIEVGAAAGLCLFPDLYGYQWSGRALHPSHALAPPVFPCAISANTPVPTKYPEIIWRAGLDLNPLDVRDRQQMRWLETLVWPEQTKRQERLRQAVSVARSQPLDLRAGDLLDDLPALIAEAPPHATKVIFHSAVLAYVEDPDKRAAFATCVSALADVWIANEAPGIFPQLQSSERQPRHGLFQVTKNGHPIAWSDPHGAALWWLAD